MSKFKAGDYVLIPKGTLIRKESSYYGEMTKSRDDQVLEVVEVFTLNSHADNWLVFGTDDERKEFSELRSQSHGWGNKPEVIQAKIDLEALTTRIKARVPSQFYLRLEGKKAVHESVATLSDKTKVVVKAAKPPTLRQQMVKDSKWKVLKDIEIIGTITNPDYTAEVQRVKNESVTRYPYPAPITVTHHGHTYQQAAPDPERDNRSKFYEDGIDKITVDHRIDKTQSRLFKDEVLTVTGKFSTYHKPGNDWSFKLPDGMAEMWVPVKLVRNGETKEGWVPFGALNGNVEAESIPTVDIYVIRDTSTGKFYSGTEYLSGMTSTGPRYVNAYVNEFMKAKQFDNVGRAKTSILSMTGYYEGLPGSENVPEWVEYGRGGKKEDFPSTWELVKFDKLGRKELDVIDLQSWFEKTWELRGLTMKFGSAVRGLYKDIETKGKLDAYKGMLVFYKKDHDAWYGDKSAFSDTELAEIDAAVAHAGLKKGEFLKKKAFDTVAVSFANAGKAMMFKLSYNGTIPAEVINLETMKEEVAAK